MSSVDAALARLGSRSALTDFTYFVGRRETMRELSGGGANPFEFPALDGEHSILRALVARDHAELGAENAIKYGRQNAV